MKKFLSVLLLALIFNSIQSFAQSGLNINSLPPFEVSEYVKPLSTYLGTYFNTGNYYNADVPETFGFKFSIIGMWTIVPEDQKTFNPNPRLDGVDNVSPSATIFGNKASYFLSNKGFYTYPTGLALKAIPLGIYQIAGSLYNTELMIRFFPKSKFGSKSTESNDEVKVGLFGFGLKHDISSHIPLFPIDLSVQLLYNQLDFEYVGNDTTKYGKISSKNFAVNAQASKTFLNMFIIYSGIQYETSTMTFGYYFDDTNNFYPDLGNRRQEVKINGDNHFRYTLGGAIKLAVVVLNADINVTSFTTFSAGFSLDF